MRWKVSFIFTHVIRCRVFQTETEKHICIKIQVNSERVSSGHQHGCCLFVLWHQRGCGDIRWKPPLQKLCEGKRKKVKCFTCITNLLQTCLDDSKRPHESTSGGELEKMCATRKKKPSSKPVLSESETDSEREREVLTPLPRKNHGTKRQLMKASLATAKRALFYAHSFILNCPVAMEMALHGIKLYSVCTWKNVHSRKMVQFLFWS